jgi:hypothetical protein
MNYIFVLRIGSLSDRSSFYMKGYRVKYRSASIGIVAAFLLLFLPLYSHAAQNHPQEKPGVTSHAQPKAFLGRWDVTLHTPEKNYGSWLELTESDGCLHGRMVGRWGHAHPVLDAKIANAILTFRSPKKEEGTAKDLMYWGYLTGNQLSGTVTGPKGIHWTWSGQRAPSLSRTIVRRWGKPIRLFNGENTEGWWFDKPELAKVWSVQNGVLVSTANGSDIITKRKFKGFKLHLEFKCATNCNSGVYLRGRYEVQITDYAGDRVPPNRKGGAVYGYIAPSPAIQITPGVWESYDITLIGRTVTVAYNGRTIIDKQEIPGPTGGALDSHEGLPGPIYLQGSEKAGATAFRNIVLTPAVE